MNKGKYNRKLNYSILTHIFILHQRVLQNTVWRSLKYIVNKRPLIYVLFTRRNETELCDEVSTDTVSLTKKLSNDSTIQFVCGKAI